ncbi:NUDIX hydrolase [Clostridium beijerinckii]|uniref:NUDIX hydrolase n=1 Tax=Clostridium beijerinckii TaxID=1520 RepID=UPI000809A713|nr:NUDIX domain-containing protein [Clostridium beijerinckii]OCB01083.1 hypothetical protein BGS1_00975 [Clostridium beijerinckii]
MKDEEKLSFYDEELNELGIALRSDIHSKGLLHKVVHFWMVEVTSNEKWVYFQQRSYKKKDFPGLYDISAAGDIDSGEDMETAVRREVQEEIGIQIDSDRLKFIGSIREKLQVKNFVNNELCQLYLYFAESPKFKIGEEVENMVKISLDEMRKLTLDSANDIEAISVDGKTKIVLKSEDFCFHDKEYIQLIIDSIEKLLLIK